MSNRATSAKVARYERRQALVDQLGDWAAAPGPLYRSLARAISAAIERGELARGERLPSERTLAEAVSVSRGVVVAAFDELVATDVVERRIGSGTFVAGALDRVLPPGREGSSLVGRLVDQGSHAAVIDLSISVLHDAPGLPVVEVSTRDITGVASDSPWGLGELRTRVAVRLTQRGLPSGPEHVVITTGAQQGISIAAGCWVRPGDVVVVDDPTYPGALAAFASAGAELRTVAVDRHGIRLAPLAAALSDHPALLYVQSGPHSPTGSVLSAHRRAEIARLVVDHRIPLVEDVALADLAWGEPSPPPIASHAGEHPVAVVGSFSKVFWAGLRVGFVRAPEPVAHRLVRVKATHDLGSSAVSQHLAVGLLDHPGARRFTVRRDRELRHRCTHLRSLLAEHLPSWSCDDPLGGLSLWVRLPAPVAARFAERALSFGVGVATADGLSASGAHRDRLRITFAAAEPVLAEAVVRLAAAWADLDP